MIVVKVELWSAITHERTELARMVIANDGGTRTRGDYKVAALRGRDTLTLGRNTLAWVTDGSGATHTGEVKNHARLSEHVWNLVAKALAAMEYGQ